MENKLKDEDLKVININKASSLLAISDRHSKTLSVAKLFQENYSLRKSSERADQELAAYREALKQLIPIAEEYEHMCYTADRFIQRGREIKSILEKYRTLLKD